MTLILRRKDLTEIPNFSDPIVLKYYGFNKPKTIKILDLSENQITKIEGLDSLVNLQKLILCENQISKIEKINKVNFYRDL